MDSESPPSLPRLGKPFKRAGEGPDGGRSPPRGPSSRRRGLLSGSWSPRGALHASPHVLAPSDPTPLDLRSDLEGDLGAIAQRGRPAAVLEQRDGSWLARGPLGSDVRASFGHAVAVSARWVAVGEPEAVTEGTGDAGVVHLFGRQGADWSEALRLARRARGRYTESGFHAAMDRGVLAVRYWPRARPCLSSSSRTGIGSDARGWIPENLPTRSPRRWRWTTTGSW